MAHPEILECMKVSGAADYVFKIRAADVEAYEEFQSRFVLKEVKATTALPI